MFPQCSNIWRLFLVLCWYCPLFYILLICWYVSSLYLNLCFFLYYAISRRSCTSWITNDYYYFIHNTTTWALDPTAIYVSQLWLFVTTETRFITKLDFTISFIWFLFFCYLYPLQSFLWNWESILIVFLTSIHSPHKIISRLKSGW